MNRVLAIDTAGGPVQVGLIGPDGSWFESLRTPHGRGEVLAAMVQHGLARMGWRGPELDGIAVAAGPGSYTGLRVGLAVAKSLAWLWERPLVGVDTLEAMALSAAWAGPLVVAALDARRGEVFGGVFAAPSAAPPVETVIAPQPLPADEFIAGAQRVARERQVRTIVAVGDGWRALSDGHGAGIGGATWVWAPGEWPELRAGAVGRLGTWYLAHGRRDDPAELDARYLKATEAERRWQQKS